MTVGIIIQARMNSERLPGKVMMELAGKPLLQHVIERCQATGLPVVVAYPTDDTRIQALCYRLNVVGYAGPHYAVMLRMLEAARASGFSHFVRVNADCVDIQTEAIAACAESICDWDCDYYGYKVDGTVAVQTHCGYPEGIKTDSLAELWDSCNGSWKEHVTAGFYKRWNKLFEDAPDIGHNTIDTQEDLDRWRSKLEGRSSATESQLT